MKSTFFWIGAVVDIIAVCVALYFILDDTLKGRSGTNNPMMIGLTSLMILLIIGAFLLKNAGKLVIANTLLWIPGFPLAMYGLFILLFIILKPDMK
jgi:hypothetical protein